MKHRATNREAGAVFGAISALIRAEHRHAAHLAPAMGHGLSEVMALYHLANEPLSAGALADRVGLSTGSTTALVDRLVSQGLAARKRHPTDRRAVLVELTPGGHARTFAHMQPFIVAVEHLCQSLPTDDRAVVVGFLGALEGIVNADTDRLQSGSRRPSTTAPQ